jgi:hypothetical protein
MSEKFISQSLLSTINVIIQNKKLILNVLKSGSKILDGIKKAENISEVSINNMLKSVVSQVMIFSRPLNIPMSRIIPKANHHSLMCVLKGSQMNKARVHKLQVVVLDFYDDSKVITSLTTFDLDNDGELYDHIIEETLKDSLNSVIKGMKILKVESYLRLNLGNVFEISNNYNATYKTTKYNCQDYCEWMMREITEYVFRPEIMENDSFNEIKENPRKKKDVEKCGHVEIILIIGRVCDDCGEKANFHCVRCGEDMCKNHYESSNSRKVLGCYNCYEDNSLFKSTNNCQFGHIGEANLGVFKHINCGHIFCDFCYKTSRLNRC